MEGPLGLLGSGGGGGGGIVSYGGSANGSMSTVSKEENLVLSCEVSSSYPDESELELGLGLSLGGIAKCKTATRGQYARILTARDFPSMVSKSSPPSSSSSSSVTKANASSAGTKRTADSFSPPRNGSSQVVGWPPIRAYRMNSLNIVVEKTNNVSNTNNDDAEGRGHPKTSLFVKVNMDGIPIGRKVDLNAHSCYETLAQTLHDMFCKPTTSVGSRRSNVEEHDIMKEATGPEKFLDGSSEFVLTYEDKDGDWMLVGDVPWGMFLCSVKRLRIMRTSEANGFAPRLQERKGRQRLQS
ncbi:unnamed protein product [Ilex paraguariensis]|uniref:Auxin-responsive protein n=1 Tax=Ilex paraguariensis TaxID=185542 RepID=A0ABC8QSX6_9AQUA